MRCPACGREYRAGTVRCRKCEVLLVESAPPTQPGASNAATPFASAARGTSRDPASDAARDSTRDAKKNQRAPLLLWSGQDPVLFSALTHELAGAAIPFYESAVHDPAAGLFASFPLRSEAVGGLEIRVAGCDLVAAQEILASVVGTIGTIVPTGPSESGGEDESVLEFANHGGASRNASDWHAADATAELWNGADEAWAEYLIDVLWENGVRARAIHDLTGISRVLVRPADYARAQQVLRLLEEATSLE
jgi:hypothetical protein